MGPKRKPELTRFWAKVDKRGKAECWPWLPTPPPGHYGRFRMFSQKNEGSHRAAWLLLRGPIPAGIFVCHHCDNRACVNPEHLFLGTPADNMRDMKGKGRKRVARGAAHGNAKLTVAKVQAIRISDSSARELAREYGVHEMHISAIRRRKAWAHVA